MTLEQFYNSKEILYVYCENLEEIKKFCDESDKLGKSMKSGCSYIYHYKVCEKIMMKHMYFSNKGLYTTHNIYECDKLINFKNINFSNNIINNSMLIVNKEKKYVLLKANNQEIKIECSEADKFDWKIGFGLALSKLMKKDERWKIAFELCRDTKNNLIYKRYALWSLNTYFKGNKDKLKEITNKVNDINEYGKVDL